MTPNSSCIPFARLDIVSQKALDFVTNKVFYEEVNTPWTPQSFIVSGETNLGHNYDVNIEYLCAPAVHPFTGDNQKLMDDPVVKKI